MTAEIIPHKEGLLTPPIPRYNLDDKNFSFLEVPDDPGQLMTRIIGDKAIVLKG